MADIRVVWDAGTMRGDWLLVGHSLDDTHQLATAVAVSLFSDRTARDDDPLPDPESADRRGWWGDWEAADVYQGATPIGSRLWLLVREKQTEDTRQRAIEYCREALAWMIDVALAVDVGVDCQWFAPGRLGAVITIYRGSKQSIEVRFEQLWTEIGIAA